MIPSELAELADIIRPGWAELDDRTCREVLATAQRILDAGYVRKSEAEREFERNGQDRW